MIWSNLFSKTILERGKRYSNSGRVKNLREQNGTYSALVQGSRAYSVTIKFQGDHVALLRCTCPYAADGGRCKHMAAVLYQIEEQENQKLIQAQLVFAEKETEVDEEAESFPQNYTYFDAESMKKNLDYSVSEWRQAVKLARSGKLSMDKATAGYMGNYSSVAQEMQGDIQGKLIVGRSSYPVRLFFDRTRIQKGHCSVKGCNCYYSPDSYGTRQICVHLLALFYHLKEYLKTNVLGDATDWTGALFLSECKTMGAVSAGSRQFMKIDELLELEPRIQSDYNGWYASFRIGGTKRYIVKNLSDLVSNSASQGTMTFGTSTVWNVGAENFSAHGKQFLKYIREIVETEKQRALQLSRNYYEFETNRLEIKNSIPLFGQYLDDFFDILGSSSIEYIEKSGKEKKTLFLTPICRNPRLTLTLKKDMDGRGFFQGVHVTGKIPAVTYGQKASYYIEAPYLCRMDADYADRLSPLFSQEEDGMIEFRIGRNRLRDFYYNVLPWLREHVEIVENDMEEVQKYLPPEARFIFYLDAEDGNMTCRPEALYGEQAVSVMGILAQKPATPLYAGDTLRDMEKEEEIAHLVLDYFPQVDAENSFFHCGGVEEAIYRVLEHGLGQLLQVGEVQATDAFRRLNIQRSPKFTIGVSVQSQLLNLSVSSDQIPQEELRAVLASYQKKKKFHRLKNGDFLKLENNSIEILEQLMSSMQLSPKELASGKMHIPAYRALYLEKMLEKNEAFYTHRDRHFKAMIKDFKTVEDSDFEVPKSLQHILRPYQVIGYQWMKTLDSYGFGGILADEMGLGKTLQAIAVLLSAKGSSHEPALIVSPSALIYNWGEELHRFAPELRVSLIAGAQQERARKLREISDVDVLVTSYDLLKRDIAEYEAITFSYEILDEAQYIKNHSTAVSKSVKIIKSRIRYALTGTPIENRLSELWSIFDYLMPGFLYPYETFRREFETPIVKNSDEAASARLKRMVSPFILRRLKKDVLKDLPEKLEEVRFAKFDADQQKLYDTQVLHMKNLLNDQDDEKFKKNKIQILSELTRLRQICCDPSLCTEGYTASSAKREACMELIRNAMEGEHKMLVFSQFASMLELLGKDLAAAGIPYYKITGSTPTKERLELVKAFNSDSTPVFLISLKAGGTGLNLTSADVVIHYDPWWNLAVQNQATDRAHRIGQENIVTVFKLIAKNSIEENILSMQALKKDMADAILGAETGGIGKLTKNELLELIGGVDGR